MATDLTVGTPTTANGSTGERLPFSAIPKRWPLVTTIQHRSAEDSQINKDARLINCYAELEPISGDYEVQKRVGVSDGNTVGGSSDTGRGMFAWSPSLASGFYPGSLYSVFANKLYKNTTPFAGTVNTVATYRWASVLGATPKLVLGNGSAAYYTDGAALTQITDVDFPASFCPGWAYLDGTLYVLRPDCGIQGSAIDDPSSWDPLNVIIARTTPGVGIALIRHLTYVVALKSTSTEPFYDAGNATGSPLARVDGAFIPYGCFDGWSVIEVDDGLHFWISAKAGTSTTLQVVKLENLKLTVVSTPPVERVLTKFFTFNPIGGDGTHAYAMKIQGHRFCVFTQLQSAFALVYDIDQNLWYEWYSLMPSGVASATSWPFVATATAVFSGVSAQFIQHRTNGKVHLVDADFVYPNDAGVLFPVDIYTGEEDFTIRRKKQLNAMIIDADQVNGSELLVRSSEDDYTNWTNFRRINLGLRLPILPGLGSFYKRAYHFRHYKNTHFRIKAAHLQMDLGTF